MAPSCNTLTLFVIFLMLPHPLSSFPHTPSPFFFKRRSEKMCEDKFERQKERKREKERETERDRERERDEDDTYLTSPANPLGQRGERKRGRENVISLSHTHTLAPSRNNPSFSTLKSR
jgi:hypothetical protein